MSSILQLRPYATRARSHASLSSVVARIPPTSLLPRLVASLAQRIAFRCQMSLLRGNRMFSKGLCFVYALKPEIVAQLSKDGVDW